VKKFNLEKEYISVKKDELLQAINSGKEFAITHKGQVVTPPYSDKDIFIYKGSIPIPNLIALKTEAVNLSEMFGSLYKVEEREDTVIFFASMAWNEIVSINLENASFDDTTSDGIMDLGDSELEDMSWHGIEYEVTNRDISDVIEAECEGTLFCIHKEEPFMFSSLVYIDDMACAREKVREYIKKIIKDKLDNNPDFQRDNLSDEQKEAAKFFGEI
jgi:hypothetical protein